MLYDSLCAVHGGTGKGQHKNCIRQGRVLNRAESTAMPVLLENPLLDIKQGRALNRVDRTTCAAGK